MTTEGWLKNHWLILVGIVLLGVATACVAAIEYGNDITLLGLAVCAVLTIAGLSGLICLVLGLVRLVSNERNPK